MSANTADLTTGIGVPATTAMIGGYFGGPLGTVGGGIAGVVADTIYKMGFFGDARTPLVDTINTGFEMFHGQRPPDYPDPLSPMPANGLPHEMEPGQVEEIFQNTSPYIETVTYPNPDPLSPIPANGLPYEMEPGQVEEIFQNTTPFVETVGYSPETKVESEPQTSQATIGPNLSPRPAFLWNDPPKPNWALPVENTPMEPITIEPKPEDVFQQTNPLIETIDYNAAPEPQTNQATIGFTFSPNEQAQLEADAQQLHEAMYRGDSEATEEAVRLIESYPEDKRTALHAALERLIQGY